MVCHRTTVKTRLIHVVLWLGAAGSWPTVKQKAQTAHVSEARMQIWQREGIPETVCVCVTDDSVGWLAGLSILHCLVKAFGV